MSHYDSLFAFNLVIENATLPILTHVKFLQIQPTQMMRGETSAPNDVSQRPPPSIRR
jgi:hypothetical protein